MVVWRAAEKDCWVVNDEKKQEKAECVICFEEFEEGDVIARLECLCRYHKVCFLTLSFFFPPLQRAGCGLTDAEMY